MHTQLPLWAPLGVQCTVLSGHPNQAGSTAVARSNRGEHLINRCRLG
jgi:hypothetical protein